MKLEQVIVTLETTIANKKMLLAKMAGEMDGTHMEVLAKRATCQFLEVNLTELNNILDHLRLVQETQAKAATDAASKAAEDSWKTNPDRMGGCYTFEEIAESRGWR